MSDFFWFSDAQWARIEPLLPQDTRGKARVDDRRVLSGIVHALKMRRALGRLSARGLRSEEDALQSLRSLGRAQREAIFSALAGAEDARIDCSSTFSSRSPATAAEKALAHGIGRTKGGRNTKLHAICDLKAVLVLLLTPGNVHDCKVAQRCIEALPPSAELVADKGYDSKALRDWLRNAAPRRSSRRARTASSSTTTTRSSTSSATSSNACSAASRTGAASPPLQLTIKLSPLSLSPPPSSGGSNESGP